MSCYHPLKGFKIGITLRGKPLIKVCSYQDNYYQDKSGNRFYDFVKLPCGRCVGCRLDKSRQWADRCMYESVYHRDNVFVTLTYDDDHLPDNGSLVPYHLTAFIKRLRRYYEYNYNIIGIRFYACGEYGSKSLRPHYHLILFGLPIFDKIFLSKNAQGQSLYTSNTLSKLWPYGYSVVGDVSWDSCAYVARYIMKKQDGEQGSKYYSNLGIVPEFVRMSRRPGIGYYYYDEHKNDIYATDSIIYATSNGVRVVKPAKYFDRLFDIESPDLLEQLKLRRQVAAQLSADSELSGTSLGYLDYLKIKESNKLDQSSKLLRKLK